MVGESGCGKTTIGRLIVGLEQASSGTIALDGEDLFKLRRKDLRRKRSTKVQLMFQDSYASHGPEDAGRPDPARAAGHPADRQQA